MTTYIGERAETRYIKHPAAGSSFPFTNGDALDAGTAILFDSNIAQLQTESCRQLVTSLGPGAVTALDYSNRSQFAGLADLGSTYGASQAPVLSSISMIPWDRRTARRFGPFYAICDADASGGGAMRKIELEMGVTLDAACTHSDFFFAVSSSNDPGTLLGGSALGFAHVSAGAGIAGQYFANPAGASGSSGAGSLTFTLPITEDMYTLEMSRADATLAAGQVQVFQFWVWFGYLFQSGTNYVDSFSAYETR